MSTLYDIFLKNRDRPIHKMHHYFVAYERHFGHLVGRPSLFLEIGAGNGGSSQMWKAWLGPMARIVSIDLNPIALQYQDAQVAIRIGDQSDPVFLKSLVDEFGAFDAVLDDGSHMRSHVLASMEFLYPKIAHNGVYMVEDVHTAYWSDWDGGSNKHTIIEVFKETVDRLNADHVRDATVERDFLCKNTSCISAYDSIVVFEKSAFINKSNDLIGNMSKRAMY